MCDVELADCVSVDKDFETALIQSALYPCLRFDEGNFYHYFNDNSKRNYTADDIRYFIENK